MANFLVSKGLQSAYNLIEVKDENTVYFCTDTGNMYLGETTLFESNAAISASLSGKTVTFQTHGESGSNGQFTLNLSSFATSSEIITAVNAVNDIIGDGFSSSSTISQQLAAVKATADAAAPQSTTYTKTEVDNKINTQIASTFRYKGSCTYAELPSSDQVVGDVWNVTDAHEDVPAGTNYAWDGEAWDPLAGAVDLTPYLLASTAASTYATKTELSDGLAGKANTSHTHTIANITDLQDALDGKVTANEAITASGSTYSLVTYDAKGLVLAGRAITANDVPTLAISKISGLQTALDGKVPTTRTVNGKALSSDVVIGGADITVGGDGTYADDTVQGAIEAIETALESKVDTTYTFVNGTDGSFTVTPSTGGSQKVTIGKPSTAGTADKVGHAITISLGGEAQTAFDGSAAVAFDVTPKSIGAATEAQGALADTAVQSVRASNTGTNISIAAAKSGTTINLTPSLTTSTVTSGGTGLTTAADVKSYVDNAVSNASLQWGEF